MDDVVLRITTFLLAGGLASLFLVVVYHIFAPADDRLRVEREEARFEGLWFKTRRRWCDGDRLGSILGFAWGFLRSYTRWKRATLPGGLDLALISGLTLAVAAVALLDRWEALLELWRALWGRGTGA
jgi:hypothetical protein